MRCLALAPAIADPLEESRRIIRAAQDRHVILRLIGGLGIRFHCHGEHVAHLREYHDIDLFGLRKESKAVSSVFRDLGYSPNTRFNYLYGEIRLQFINEGSSKKVDVFLDKFRMEHTLDSRPRLLLDELTVPITDLLLTRLQNKDLEEKDLKDVVAVVEDHQLGHIDDHETMNIDYITALCSRDWGLFKTVTGNLERISDYVRTQASGLKGTEELLQKLETILDHLKTSKKRLRWRVRSVFGERIK